MSFVEGLVLIILIICVSTILLAIIQRIFSHQGSIIVETDENSIHYSLEFDGDPYEIQNMRRVSFRVLKKKEIAD